MSSRTYPLAVIAPHLGATSETFIRRHVEDLLPSGTVVVAGAVHGQKTHPWQVTGPMMRLDTAANASNPQARFLDRAKWVAARRFGLRSYQRAVAGIMKRFLRKHGVQVILGEYLDFCLPCLTVARDLGIRLFVHPYGYDYSTVVKADPEICNAYLDYNHAAGIIAASRFVKSRLTAWGLEPDKIHVVPHGIDVPAEPLIRPRRETIRCVAVGRMVPKKSPLLTLHAFLLALQKVPALRLDYIGTGALFPAVHEFVEAFKLEGRVTLHGPQPNAFVLQTMRQADILLQHSRTDPLTGDEEGMGVSLVEAMAQALPVVATRHDGIPETVSDGETAFLVEEGDSTGMAEKLVALARDPELRLRMGLAGWERAGKHFTWAKEREALLEIMNLH